MKITVIIPVYNREREIGRALQSVLSQGDAIVEVIVVDDGSTDGTSDAVKAYAERDARVELVNTENGGASKARNTGLLRAKTEWVAFLDSDDEWHEGRIETIVAIAAQNPEVDFIHGDRTLLSQVLEEQLEFRRSFPGRCGEDTAYLLKHMIIKTSTVLVRTNLVRSMNPWFREDLKTCEDYEFFWRLVLAARSIAYDASGKVRIHITPHSLTHFANNTDRLRDQVRARYYTLRWAQSHRQPSHFIQILRSSLFNESKALFYSGWAEGVGPCLIESLWLIKATNAGKLWTEGFRRLMRRYFTARQRHQ